MVLDARFASDAARDGFTPGAGGREWFKDHDNSPQMVVIPAGTFLMGSPEDEPEREPWEVGTEGPQHQVTFASPFAIGRYAVTRAEFAAFIAATGYTIEPGALSLQGQDWRPDPRLTWREPGFTQDDTHPVVCISWDDAKAYVDWLVELTGQPYRLQTEAEREYACRSGASTPFWWGSAISSLQANFDGRHIYAGGGALGAFRQGTVAVSSFAANPWGLFNVHGNVWEWCEDAWHNSYAEAPSDGSAWVSNGNPGNRLVRGGSWINQPRFLRAATRCAFAQSTRSYNFGFRVARGLAT